VFRHCVPASPLYGVLKYLTAASIFSSVLSGVFRDSFSWTKCRKALQFAYLMFKYSCFSWFCTYVVGITVTGEWPDERSKHDLAIVKFWVIPFVMQKSTSNMN
jgi:hypothetical protein